MRPSSSPAEATVGSKSARARETDRLDEGNEVYACDRRGRWRGVVYGVGTCGATIAIERREAYRGGCRSGRVFVDLVSIYADRAEDGFDGTIA